MIFCFSGTGNSRYIAKRIAEALEDDIIDLNARIKARDTSSIQTGQDVILVTPTYAWRIPRIVSAWIARTEWRDARRIWFVMDCGAEIGNAARYNREIAARKHLCDMGTAQVIMPENYIAMFRAPQAKEAREIVARAEPCIDEIVFHLKNGEAFPAPRNNLYDRLMSGPVNPIFYRVVVKAKAFRTGDACTGCGQCVRRCPVNNIRLIDKKPVWGEKCTHCMACICYCPAKAIEYGKKSVGKPRYHFEALRYGK